MVFSRFLNRMLLPFLLVDLALFLILSSCTTVTSTQRSDPTATPDGVSVTVPRCRLSSCTPSASGTVPGSIPGVRPFIDTWDNIHLFQSFVYKIHDPASIAKYYDFVWGVTPDKFNAFRSAHPNTFISYYILFHRDNGTFADAQQYHDLAYWKTYHPDWVLYKCDRVTPAYEYGEPYVPLDFANPGLVSWQVQTYAQPASKNGYDAIAADNLDLENLYGACGVYINGKWVQRYTGEVDDPQWRNDIITWATQMQRALHSLGHPLALIPNVGFGGIPLNDPQMQQLVSHIDGVLDEAGFTHYSHSFLTGQDWVQTIQFIESVQQQHKPYYIVNEFGVPRPDQISHDQLQWALASYLMCKEHTAAVFISPIQWYGEDIRHNEYNARVGSPLGPMYNAQNVYWRDYLGGLVVVNPSATDTFTVTTSGSHYVDLYGSHIARTFTIPPHSGMILLNG